jgi:hypothetical protein
MDANCERGLEIRKAVMGADHVEASPCEADPFSLSSQAP